MKIYLTSDSLEVLVLPMEPEELEISTSVRMITYDTAQSGEFVIPRGENLVSIKWSSMLPGYVRRRESFVHDWKSPYEIATTLTRWMHNGNTIKLLITESTINHDVYIESFDTSFSGGYGDYDYNISFVGARKPTVSIYTPEVASFASFNDFGTEREVNEVEQKGGELYTVVSGDSLWKIAQKFLGNGSRYTEIYDANSSIIKNPNLIYPGQQLTIPPK